MNLMKTLVIAVKSDESHFFVIKNHNMTYFLIGDFSEKVYAANYGIKFVYSVSKSRGFKTCGKC